MLLTFYLWLVSGFEKMLNNVDLEKMSQNITTDRTKTFYPQCRKQGIFCLD